MTLYQHTIAKEVSIEGNGLHSGKPVRVTLKPADTYDGLIFHRTDVTPAGSGIINLCATSPVRAELCTKIQNDYHVHLSTIEHLMAALFALKIDNLLIEIDSDELPILDGSSMPWVELLDKAGRMMQDEPRKRIKVLKEVKVEEGMSVASVKPSSRFNMRVFVHYGSTIPPQKKDFNDDETAFRLHVARARTFCLKKEIDYMQNMGLIKGGNLDNAVVFDESGQPLNEEGLRYSDEALRHKALDAMGDLYVAGYHIIGGFNLTRSGHELNNKLLRALLENPENWRWH